MIDSGAVVRIPERPVPAAKPGFPVVATVAPVLLSVVMWAITGSAYMLLFAALGPVIAVSTMFDSRRGLRKARAAAESQFGADLTTTLAQIAVLQSEQRQTAWAHTPSVVLIADADARADSRVGATFDAVLGATATATATATAGTASGDAPATRASATLSRWQREAIPIVALGTGTVPNTIRIESSRAAGLAEAELARAALGCPGAPVVASAGGGIGLIGPAALTTPIARGLVLQLAHRLHPSTLVIGDCSIDRWEWLRHLPHPATRRAAGDAAFELVVREGAMRERSGTGSPGIGAGAAPMRGAPGEVLIAFAESSGALPPGCETIVRVDGPQVALVLRSPEYRSGLQFRPELVSLSQARQVAATLSAAANDLGLTRSVTRLPHHVALDELWVHTGSVAANIEFAAGLELTAGVEFTTNVTPEAGVEQGAGIETRTRIERTAVNDQGEDRSRLPLRSLRCPIGIGPDGVVFVDLIADGPHAIVGGTTGSGKSELLVTWVVSMSAEFSASALTFLLVDFKGGATFDVLARLPHCVGLITDLNAREAQRALESLRAEIRYREETLRRLGARDITADQTGALPRLVIVVDEFQAMLDAFPLLHAVFLDVAARGRSLGIHLILCTQRPAGIVRDALLANCSLRLSLRVNNRADSVAVLGTGAAADIELAHAGRCVVAVGELALLCQVAVTGQSQIDRVVAASVAASVTATVADHRSPRRPWLDPLPTRIDYSDLEDVDPTAVERNRTALLLGLTDDPARQRYAVATYDPVADGALLVVGRHHSGRSSLIAVLASQSGPALDCTVIPADAEAVWDALSAAVRTIERAQFGRRRHGAPALLLFDDFDAVCASWGVEHQESALEMLGDVLRRGPGVGLYCVIAVEQLMPGFQRIRSLIPSTLLLGVGTAAEHIAFGGPGELYDDAMTPGGGFWRGLRTQLLAWPDAPIASLTSQRSPQPASALSPEPASALSPSPASCAPSATADDATATISIHLAERPSLVVVSGRPGMSCAFLRDRVPEGTTITDVGVASAAGAQLQGQPGPGPRPGPGQQSEALTISVLRPESEILVGDMEAWQAQWPLFISLRRHALVVFEYCSLADYRLITRSRTLPPYLSPGRGHLWVLGPDGEIQRGVFV